MLNGLLTNRMTFHFLTPLPVSLCLCCQTTSRYFSA